MKIYIDFDGTLFDSTIQYQRLINLFKKYNIDEIYIQNLMKEDFYQKEKSYDLLAEKIISNKNLNPNIIKEIDNIYTKDLVYPDVIPFLEKYHNKFELLLLTLGNKLHQEKKIKASNLNKYFKKLSIDYQNSIFIDNNPKELEKFYNANAKHVIRIKRNVDKYSKISLKIKEIPEFIDFNELTKSNYLDKIGENYE